MMSYFTVRGPVPLVLPYSGPGDIAAGALCWGGIRAYSAAKIGTACVRIKRADTVEKDIVTASSGIIDVSDSHFNGSTPYEIVKIYDQVSNSYDIDILVGAAGYPVLTLGDNGALPCITCVDDRHMKSTNKLPTHAQPISISVVARSVTVGSYPSIATTGDAPMILGFTNAAGTVRMYDNAEIDASATDGVTHSLQALFNAASSILCVNGANTAGTVTSDAIATPAFSQFNFPDNFPTGAACKVWEAGWWMSDISSSFSALSANQHSKWNF